MRDHYRAFQRRKVLDEALASGNEEIELLIKTDARRQEQVARELDNVGRVKHVYGLVPYLSVSCERKDAVRLRNAVFHLAEEKGFEFASAIPTLDLSSPVNIPVVERSNDLGLWNLDAIGLEEALSYSDGQGVKIGIIDTGVDYTHPEIRGRFGSGKGHDFVDGRDPKDRNGHGTHVAGIAAGIQYGIARGATLYSLRVLDEKGGGSEADVVAALDWAGTNGIDVVNMSLGAPSASSALEDMCNALADEGVLLVAAAGNNGYGANYPAAFGDAVIAVAAVDKQLTHPGFSNIYETNDISAPGVHVTSSYLGGYRSLSGTSMASPHVAGTLALALSALRRNADLEQLMGKTAQELGEHDVFGAGLVRADSLVGAAAGSSLAAYGREIVNVFREVIGV
jgi:subtilisin family serine protease